ncbi:MAG: hypothetical protein ACK4UN_00120 [Limisphaerales bacterium]
MNRIFQEIGSTEEKLLVRPEWLPILLFSVSVVAGFVATIAINPGTILGMFSTLAGTCAAIGFLGVKLTETCRTEFPKDMRTVGEFSRWLIGRNPKLVDDQRSVWTREQIAARVREIVVDILGCEKDYREDARFIQDLGMD